MIANSAARTASVLADASPSASGQAAPPGALSLPCISGADCGSEPLYVPATHGASADEVQLLLDGLGATEIPVISQAAGIVSAGIDVGKGDWVGASLGAAGLIPLIGNAADAAKIARRAQRVVDVVHGNSKLSTRAQHGYEVFEKATAADRQL